tara:strand:+ start:226 stop:375 length:150 start_codon:yes stop_codon:yes gene_type:complete
MVSGFLYCLLSFWNGYWSNPCKKSINQAKYTKSFGKILDELKKTETIQF